MSHVTPKELLEALAAECAAAPAPAPAPPPPAAEPPPLPSGVVEVAGEIVTPAGRRVPRAEAVRLCREALRGVETAVQGDNGSKYAYKAARLIWNDYALEEAEGFPLLREYSATCKPPWTEKQLRHKWDSAVKKGPGEQGRGYKLDQQAGGDPAPTTPPEDPFPSITSEEFAGGDYRPQWLVEGVLVKNQPGVIAGPPKALKTSLALDLAISLASATRFLGQYPVPRRVRTAVVSGESGPHTLQETTRRQCAARGLDLAGLKDDLCWCFQLPTVSSEQQMANFAKQLKGMGAEVVFIDPLYLCLGAVDPKNVFEMGSALRAMGEELLRQCVTPILIHHANAKLQTGEVMELTHLSYTGLEQYARQFLLINRQSQYRGDGKHELLVSFGGSAGHGGLLSVTVEEGVIDRDFGGRTWHVTVRESGEARAEQAARRERAREEAARKKVYTDAAKVIDLIDAAAGKGGVTKTILRNRTGWGMARVNAALAQLFDEELIRAGKGTKGAGNGAKISAEVFVRAKGGEEADLFDTDQENTSPARKHWSRPQSRPAYRCTGQQQWSGTLSLRASRTTVVGPTGGAGRGGGASIRAPDQCSPPAEAPGARRRCRTSPPSTTRGSRPDGPPPLLGMTDFARPRAAIVLHRNHGRSFDDGL